MPADRVAAMVEALQDDLDTPRAVLLLRELERDPDVSPGAKFETFAYLDRVLGLDLTRTVGQVAVQEEIPADVTALVEARAAARAAKDWAASDRLRDELTALGWTVTDTPDGPQVTRA
jgi:cysteinyl-tRNA synthetase